MSNYRDRGILKWAPFDALDGHSQMIEDLIFNLAKKEKPSLSEDEYEELNTLFKTAIDESLPITINYYNDGFINTTYGRIKKFDDVKNELILDSKETIDVSLIISAEL